MLAQQSQSQGQRNEDQAAADEKACELQADVFENGFAIYHMPECTGRALCGYFMTQHITTS